MSIFQPYVGLTTTARKEWEKIHGKLSRNNVPNIMQDMLDISLTHLPQIPGSLNQDTITILLEMTHYLLSHKVYYVETALARSLMKTNINLQLSDLKLPYRIFEVSFKDDLKTPEGPIPSFLIAIMPGQSEINACNAFLNKSNQSIPWQLNNSMGNLVYVRYQAAEGGICHANIPAEFFVDRSIDEAVEALGKNRLNNTFKFTVEFSDSDKKIQSNLLRIAMGLLCYINTENPDMQEWKNKNRPAFGLIKPDSWRIGASIPDSWFLRKGHFMVLRHERYKRQDGKTRIVWRRPHEVLHKEKPLVPDAREEIIDS
jgi:hypothetical protein